MSSSLVKQSDLLPVRQQLHSLKPLKSSFWHLVWKSSLPSTNINALSSCQGIGSWIICCNKQLNTMATLSSWFSWSYFDLIIKKISFPQDQEVPSFCLTRKQKSFFQYWILLLILQTTCARFGALEHELTLWKISSLQSNLIFPSGVSVGGCTLDRTVKKEFHINRKHFFNKEAKYMSLSCHPYFIWCNRNSSHKWSH